MRMGLNNESAAITRGQGANGQELLLLHSQRMMA